jgi:hypothetical protein
MESRSVPVDLSSAISRKGQCGVQAPGLVLSLGRVLARCLHWAAWVFPGVPYLTLHPGSPQSLLAEELPHPPPGYGCRDTEVGGTALAPHTGPACTALGFPAGKLSLGWGRNWLQLCYLIPLLKDLGHLGDALAVPVLGA